MPPQKYVQQSQVHVYKTIGTGGRARLKMVPVPKEGISTATETPDLSRPEPPTVLPPDFGGEQNDRGNQPGLGQMDFEFPKKRKGKVSCGCAVEIDKANGTILFRRRTTT